jgi:hypothetical protein
MTNASGTFNVDYAAYQARYAAVPATGNSNLWYSFDHGPAHYTFIDSEESQDAGSPQLTWLAADLAAADARRATTPWLFVAQHRPVFCSTKSEEGDHTPGGRFPRSLEPLLKQYHVDVVLTGHEHLYERSQAIFNGTVVTAAEGANNTYASPGAPVYIVAGASGAFQSGDWIAPQPKWSAFRTFDVYGYGRMRISGAHRLTYDFVEQTTGKVADHWEISK